MFDKDRFSRWLVGAVILAAVDCAGLVAIEAALTIEGMRNGIILPTINHLPDPALSDIDVVPDTARRQSYDLALSNAFGFGGTNCCVILRGV